jgi:hypothetical protein
MSEKKFAVNWEDACRENPCNYHKGKALPALP